METSRLEEIVYSALINDSDLMGLLPMGESSIFHLQAPSVLPEYPILVYSPIDDTPILHGDNKEFMHRVTIRIHIIAENYSEIFLEIKRIMSNLRFTRLKSFPFIEDGKKMLITDFKKIVGA